MGDVNSSAVSVVVFTRDLRVHDNPVLAAAAAAPQVVPLFVFDDAILAGAARAAGRLRFLDEALADLDVALRARGGRLVVRRGRFVEEVCRVAAEAGAAEVHIAADVSGYAQARQARLVTALAADRRRLVCHDRVHTVVDPGDVVPAGRDHFSVFTPYFRRWSELPPRPRAATPRRIAVPAVDGEQLSAVSPAGSYGRFPGGETAGRARARVWTAEGGLSGYADAHDDLAADATSRLSPYLHFGCLSAAELAAETAGAARSDGTAAFLRQLAWRDFHHQVLAARPEVVRQDYRPRGDTWRDDPQALQAWSDGRTGIPIVDAGMRQLAAEGWMHNRARLITASFLTKTLYLDWRAGAAHFARLLLDADVANNVLNWQWVAGTGNDTRPNRVLNPLRQAERYDPAGEYVRRHVPELAGLANPADVHRPWRLGADALRRLGYPAPIVELDAARRRFLAARAEPLW